MAKTLVLWLGGVICRTPGDAVIHSAAKIGGPPAPDRRVRIRDLTRELTLGRLDGRAFLLAATAVLDLAAHAHDLEAELLAGETVGEDLARLLDELVERHRLCLLCDYPREWLERLVEGLGLNRWFSESARLLLPELGLPAVAPDLYASLPGRVGSAREDALLIEPDPRRAASAVRVDLNTILYQGPWRLGRELRLRQWLPWPPS